MKKKGTAKIPFELVYGLDVTFLSTLNCHLINSFNIFLLIKMFFKTKLIRLWSSMKLVGKLLIKVNLTLRKSLINHLDLDLCKLEIWYFFRITRMKNQENIRSLTVCGWDRTLSETSLGWIHSTWAYWMVNHLTFLQMAKCSSFSSNMTYVAMGHPFYCISYRTPCHFSISFFFLGLDLLFMLVELLMVTRAFISCDQCYMMIFGWTLLM